MTAEFDPRWIVGLIPVVLLISYLKDWSKRR